ncbi:RHS repeat protein [Chryseobacterium indologenes]|uniref:RHS repeat protein n=1 Tax=Chryseobacterium indologenes TaxID=253 RepID=UPI00102412E2|nr:RHS repeat protein [Chryseobacterium indologenes]VFA41232.1 Uncharacterised protein [Chryseobacterium indologenes]
MKKYITLSLIALAPYFIKSQVNPGNPYSPAIFSNSPNAASLSQYNPTDIDLFSGQPNINFNLFNFSKEGYNLNLDLSYSLASIKPDTPPTWVGAGWNLNVGGVITRTVKGGVDEVLVSTDPVQNKYSYYDNFNTLDNAAWDSDNARSQFINNNRSIGGGTRTVYPAPDEFNFNVNGMSGTFYKNHNGQWVVASGDFKDIKITSELTSDFKLYDDGYRTVNSKTHNIKRIIYGFTLTDHKGIQYIFGKTPQSIEFTASPPSQAIDPFNPHFIVNSWFLTKVILPSNFEIEFSYERENKALFKMHHTFTSLYYNINSGTTSGAVQQITKTPEKTFVTYLKGINVNNLYTIDFLKSKANVEQYNFTDISNSQWNASFQYTNHFRADIMAAKQFYKLDKVSIIKNAVIEEINFNYLEDPEKKLFLNGFTKKSGETYQLDYYSTDLPKYNQMRNDHWGYYNNKSFLTSVAPANGTKYSVDQMKNILPAYKETDPGQLTKGVLKKITYPTKGYSEFIYEPHDYNKVIEAQTSLPFEFFIEPSEKKIAGGLRIKKTITDPGDAQNIIKEYYYTDTGTATGNSTGVLSGKPVYFEEDQNSGARIYRFADMPILPSNNTRGKHVVYTKVTEKTSETNNNGTTEYIFSNSDNGYLDKRANGFSFFAFNNSSIYNNLRKMSYNSLDFERGKPLNIIKKDKNGNIVHQTNFKYNDSPARFENTIRAYDFQSNVYGEPIYYGAYTYLHGMAELIRLAAYNIYAYNPYLSEKKEIYYYNNVPSLTETTQYTYESAQHNQMTKQTFLDSSGILKTSSLSYAHEKDNQLMISKNMVGIPLETITSQTTNGATKTLSRVETMYPSSVPTSQSGDLVLPLSVKTYDILNNIPSTEVTYDYYDNKGNVIQYTTKDGATVGIVWGYNKSLPIAKIEGKDAAYFMTMLADENNTLSIASNSDIDIITEENFRTKLDLFQSRQNFFNVLITTYTHDPLIGVTSITPPSKIRTFYKYDSAGRLEKVVDANGQVLKEMKYNYKN